MTERIDWHTVDSTLRQAQAVGVLQYRVDKAGKDRGGKPQRRVTVLEATGGHHVFYVLDSADRFPLDRDGLAAYADRVRALDDFWSAEQELELAALGAPPAADSEPVADGLPSFVTEWLGRLVSAEKRAYAAAYCAWNLNLREDCPPDPGTGWAEKARKRADRLFREPFDRVAAGVAL